MTDQPAEMITIATGDGPMPAQLWRPAAGIGPGVVLLHEIFGISDYIQARGRDLAALGYVVCAPDVYWRLDDRQIDESRADVLQQAMAVVQRVDWPTAVRDMQAALSHVRGMIEVEGGVGLLGFCFGGGLAFNVAAVDDVDVLVCYYGSSLGDLLDLAGDIQAPSLHHFGLADAFIPAETIADIQAAVTAHGAQFETYEGANHAFDNPSPPFYHAEASARAWGITIRFLNRHLPT